MSAEAVDFRGAGSRSRAPDTTLYGREDAVEAVTALLEGVRQGRGGALVVTGAPGMGRTSLIDVGRRQAVDLIQLGARGAEAESSLPYAGLHRLLLPLADVIATLPGRHGAVLRHVLGFDRLTEDDPAADLADELAAGLGDLFGGAEPHVETHAAAHAAAHPAGHPADHPAGQTAAGSARPGTASTATRPAGSGAEQDADRADRTAGAIPADRAAEGPGAGRGGADDAAGNDPLLLRAAVHRLLTTIAAQYDGLLCWVDDAHWWDQPSLDVLAFVARRIERDPVGILLGWCDAGWGGPEGAGTPDGVSDGPAADIPVLRLEPLTDADALRLLARRGPRPPEVLRRILDLAAGTPGALMELADALPGPPSPALPGLAPADGAAAGGTAGLEPGWLAAAGTTAAGTTVAGTAVAGAAASAAVGGPRPLVIPHDVRLPAGSRFRAACLARFRRLPAPARQLVLLAVCDDHLELETVARAARALGADLGMLDAAIRAGLLVRRPAQAAPPLHTTQLAQASRLAQPARAAQGGGRGAQPAQSTIRSGSPGMPTRPSQPDGFSPLPPLLPAGPSAANATRLGFDGLGSSRVDVAHPLLRPILAEADPAGVEAAHDLLADLLDGEDQRLRRALHQAAVPGPDRAALGDQLADAAAEARRRGEHVLAARGYRRAAQLTGEARTRAERLLAAAAESVAAGQPWAAQVLVGEARRTYDSPDMLARSQVVAGQIELSGGRPERGRRNLVAAASKLTEADGDQAMAVLRLAGEAGCFAGTVSSLEASAALASDLSRQLGSPAADLTRSHFTGLNDLFGGRFSKAVPALRRVVERCRGVEDPLILVMGSVAALGLGQDADAHALAADAVECALSEPAGPSPALPLALEFRALSEIRLGWLPQARASAFDGLWHAVAAGQENYAISHLAVLAMVSALQGDRADAVRRAETVIERAAGRGLARPAAIANWALAIVDLSDGNAAAATNRLRLTAGDTLGGGQAATGWGGDDRVGERHVGVGLAAVPYLVEAAVASGRVAEALPAWAAFECWATDVGSPSRLALVERCRALLAGEGQLGETRTAAARTGPAHLSGDLHGGLIGGPANGLTGAAADAVAGTTGSAAAGDRADLADRVDEHLRAALEYHRLGDCRGGFEHGRTALMYGRRLRRARRRDEAVEHLRDALRMFERADARHWAEQARAELRAAGAPVRGVAGATAEALTPQQLEVARLVAAGATNREVARQLTLSPRTVDYHLRNIFARLGIRSRVELARMLPP